MNEQITSPCGVCRQALFEFGGPELNVSHGKDTEDFIERSMDELLPFGFGSSNVAGNSAVEGKTLPLRGAERTEADILPKLAKGRRCLELRLLHTRIFWP